MRAAAAQIQIGNGAANEPPPGLSKMEALRWRKTQRDGTRYQGQMQSGKFNGQGVMTYADGRVESGEWETGTFLGQATAADSVAMQAKYPELKECAALVKLGLRATDTVRVMHSTGLYYHIAWTLVVPIGCLDVICAHHIV